ncbi:MAG: ABC transporter permease [Fusobacterium mortiferum]|jgi:simple sugar transport system permease protein|uniref:ABC transporter permease n=1 Tax=Fusobacterium TaxID=848 RepID=UPI0012B275A4|nr:MULTISPECIES: ABC transporter permease [Fusobacterium]MCF2628442.1 ABC transporter permease [Fusobacterium mortiferum]MCF2700208.1 ABC transporter permease [Fusobacterium mortiferum]MCI6381619.1 ABC transporter permease [Fusobacterium mortiferum]MCI7188327.1 ABC transporter permease [Fusobacterium mortiferum]MCI7665592.1 ABC transporter permease [Fusobacterium mortiferum]
MVLEVENKIKKFLINNIVPIFMIIIIVASIPISGLSMEYIIQEIILRLSRNLFLVLSLLIPIIAGMGLNFGIVLGAMAGQLALIFITDWQIVGLQGFFLAIILSLPMGALMGLIGGVVLNRAKGREMITSMILGFFINGVYQLIVLYGMGKVIPITDSSILLSRGYGIRNAIDLKNIRRALDDAIVLKIGEFSIPLLTIVAVVLFCLFIVWFRKTKLGQDMRAIGQDLEVSKSAGIAADRTRVIAIVISTMLAAIGQIIFLQNIGTMNTYNSHEQIGMFSIAALLIGGASVAKASIPNALSGVILFHAMFILAPRAGKELIGSAQIGEYFRVFVSYGIIALVLIMHQWRREKEKAEERRRALEAAQNSSKGEDK